MTQTENLIDAADAVSYLTVNRFAGTVTYRPALDGETFTAKAHDWLPEYNVENADGKIVGRRKTVKGALALLTRLADAAYGA